MLICCIIELVLKFSVIAAIAVDGVRSTHGMLIIVNMTMMTMIAIMVTSWKRPNPIHRRQQWNHAEVGA